MLLSKKMYVQKIDQSNSGNPSDIKNKIAGKERVKASSDRQTELWAAWADYHWHVLSNSTTG